MKNFATSPKKQFIENTLFYFFLIANLLPLYLTYFVGSLDGPKHLQIANIIKELWRGNELFVSYFELSPIYTANILGNYILALERFILPAWLSEKVFLTFYVILITTGFRYFILSITKKPGVAIFFIFPLTYTSLFLMGYYNYSIAFGFTFFAVGYYLRHFDNMNIRNIIGLMILILLTYYSHFFVFGFLISLLGAITIQKAIINFEKNEESVFKSTFLKFRGIFIATAPSLVLSIPYFRLILEQPVSDGGNEFNRWSYLSDFRILIGFVPEEELHLTRFLFWGLIAFTLYHIGLLIYSFVRTRQSIQMQTIFKSQRFGWGILLIFYFGFYFLMPNNLNASGNILPRILVMGLYLLLTWISLRRTHLLINLLVLSMILYFSISINSIHLKYRRHLDQMIIKIKNIEYIIPPNSIVLNRNFLDSWNTYHFQSYIGTDKPYINLNSLAISPLFAVRWAGDRPQTFVGGKFSDNFSSYMNIPNVKGTTIADFVTIVGEWGFNSLPDNNEFKSLILRDYLRQDDENNLIVDLYKLNIRYEIDSLQNKLINNEYDYKMLKEKEVATHLPFVDVVLREAIGIYDMKNPNDH